MKSGYAGYTPIICADEAENLHIYLPPAIRCAKELLTINKKGEIVPLEAEKTSDGIRLSEPLRRCEPCYVIVKK